VFECRNGPGEVSEVYVVMQDIVAWRTTVVLSFNLGKKGEATQ